ncbi:MAG: hypothetical protein QGH51_02110 [Planctomycetota bacterium]|jgi:hypothetical protein|nr:hypothetical protein [Planctomycetota bacterium]MDP6940796.1 hypothetical protein [Planctomycetota bacterium]
MSESSPSNWVLPITGLAIFALVAYLATLGDSGGKAPIVDDVEVFSPTNSDGLAAEFEPASTRKPLPEEDILPSAPPPLIVQCFQKEKGTPLPGIQLYLNTEVVAAVGAKDGSLKLPPESSKSVSVLWKPGWNPHRFFAGEVIPEKLYFVESNANLVVRIQGMKSNWRIVRSQLQSREFPSTDKSPWRPILRKTEHGSLRADKIPPGVWDIYVWIAHSGNPPEALTRQMLTVPAGETTTVPLLPVLEDMEDH